MTPLILSSQINTHFDAMKQHVINIDEKDITKVHAFVEKYLTPKEYEKKAFGEVFTPLSLVREMLDAIQNYANKDFWKNKDLKILDPAAGIGNFPLIAYEKLMEGLKQSIPNAERRKRHILEKMLYMVELNPNNVRLMRKIFGGGTYKLNIIRGDFLCDATQDKMRKEWGVDKYDLVMGNPPFSKPVSRKSSTTSTGKIWQDFIEKPLSTLLRDGGYLVMIHPPSWRQTIAEKGGRSEVYKKMREKQMITLTMLAQSEGKRYFNVPLELDWYVLKNSKGSKKCKVVDIEGIEHRISLHKVPFLPSHSWQSICKLIQITKHNHHLLYDGSSFESRKSYVISTKTSSFDIPIVHIIKANEVVYLWTNKDSRDKYGKQLLVPKIIITKSAGNKIEDVVVDIKGQLLMSQNAFALKIHDVNDAQKMKTFVKSKEFHKMISATKGSSMFIDHRMFSYFVANFWDQNHNKHHICDV